MKVRVKFYDGKSSKEHLAILEFTKDSRLVIEDFNIDVPLSSVEISSRLGDTPRVINLPGGARCKCDDNDTIDKILDTLEIRRSKIYKLERSWKLAIASVALIAAFVVFMLTTGADYSANFLANVLPKHSLDYASKKGLARLDKTILHKSNLSKEKKQKILALFNKLTGGSKDYKLHFRSSPKMGANAFALPSGDIVLLDELVMLDKDKNLYGVLGVLAHEKGHVVYKHGLKGIIKGAIASTVVGYVTGDLSFIATAIPTVLVTSRYSRKFESQADSYAKSELKRLGISTKPLARLFINLEKFYAKKYHDSNATNYMGWMSTHPVTKERVKFFMSE